jgi:hypothetical protein
LPGSSSENVRRLLGISPKTKEKGATAELQPLNKFGSGERIWTSDLRVMSQVFDITGENSNKQPQRFQRDNVLPNIVFVAVFSRFLMFS